MAKQGGGGFFRIDGPFVKYGNLLFDFIALDIQWLVVSGIVPLLVLTYLTSNTALSAMPPYVYWPIAFLLIIHWGPATSAMFYTFGKRQRGTDSYTFRDYWHAYKSDYKQAIKVSAAITAVAVLIGWNVLIMITNSSVFGVATNIIVPLEALLAVETAFITLYILPMLARFEMPTKDLFRNSFFMANKHLPFTLLAVLVAAGCFALVYYVHVAFSLIIVSIYCYLETAILERVFRNYMPNEDDALEEEDFGDFSISDERQAIINRYLGRSTENSALDEGEVVRVDETGNVINEADYKVVKVEKDDETAK